MKKWKKKEIHVWWVKIVEGVERVAFAHNQSIWLQCFLFASCFDETSVWIDKGLNIIKCWSQESTNRFYFFFFSFLSQSFFVFAFNFIFFFLLLAFNIFHHSVGVESTLAHSIEVQPNEWLKWDEWAKWKKAKREQEEKQVQTKENGRERKREKKTAKWMEMRKIE